MSIYFVNRFYWPDLSATSQMLTDLAEGLSSEHQVKVITSRKLYLGGGEKLKNLESVNGVEIVRLYSSSFTRSNLLYRLLDYLGFYILGAIYLLRHINDGDIVVLKTDPPLMPLIYTPLVSLKGGRVINWVQDLFPEVVVTGCSNWISRLLNSLIKPWRNMSLRRSKMNVVIGEDMQHQLIKESIVNTTVIPNWANGNDIYPIQHSENKWRQSEYRSDDFIVGYSGNLGRVHSFHSLVDAAENLSQESNVRFLIIGDGAAKEYVQFEVQKRQLQNMVFMPHQPRDNLRYSLGAIDIHLVSLREIMNGLVLPSKIYGIMSAGRPIIFIGDIQCDIAKMITENEIGLAVESEDVEGLVAAILRLSRDKECCQLMGSNSRKLFDRRFDFPHAYEQWKRVLADAVV